MIFFKSLTLPRLEHCVLIPVFVADDNVGLDYTKRSFTAQNDSSKIYHWERLRAPSLSSLECRQERNIVIHTWKIPKVLLPFLHSKIIPYRHERHVTPDNNTTEIKMWEDIREHCAHIRDPSLFTSLQSCIRNIMDRPG